MLSSRASRSLRQSRTNMVRFMSVINLSTDDAVEKFRMINSKSVLYFTAQWCGPCRTVGPIVEQMSKTYPTVAFGKVDVDENSDSAVDFEIAAVPTFVVFEGETAIHKFSGADPVQLEKHVKLLSEK